MVVRLICSLELECLPCGHVHGNQPRLYAHSANLYKRELKHQRDLDVFIGPNI
jgi:hypothetical protein